MTKVYTIFKDGESPIRVTLPPGATDSGPPDGWIRVDGDYADGTWEWDAATESPVKKPSPAPIVPPLPFAKPIAEVLWGGVRAHRNKLLAETDYIVIRAAENAGQAPLAWRQYRQALRDITNQVDPLDITWPTPPA